ncbi:MAG: hypothetical protein R2752_10715 [Vicinamibacterales bacterium]
MSFRRRLRTLAVCLVLEAGALLGSPMRVEELEDLLRSLNQPRVARTDPEARESGDGPRGPDRAARSRRRPPPAGFPPA